MLENGNEVLESTELLLIMNAKLRDKVPLKCRELPEVLKLFIFNKIITPICTKL